MLHGSGTFVYIPASERFAVDELIRATCLIALTAAARECRGNAGTQILGASLAISRLCTSYLAPESRTLPSFLAAVPQTSFTRS
jgi:hypothetical protein